MKFHRVANIYRHVIITHQQTVNAFDQIIHITKTPGLGSIAKNSKVFSTQCLPDKCRQCTSIIQSHTWTISIKYPYDPCFHTMKSMIGHGNCFLETFCFIIYTSRTNRIYISPVFFILRMN